MKTKRERLRLLSNYGAHIVTKDNQSYVYLDGKWHSNSVAIAIKEGWSRTRLINAAREAGEEVDIAETIKQAKADPMVRLVLQSGEIFRGDHDGFSRFNPIEQACYGMLPGLQI